MILHCPERMDAAFRHIAHFGGVKPSHKCCDVTVDLHGGRASLRKSENVRKAGSLLSVSLPLSDAGPCEDVSLDLFQPRCSI